jgi:hypothetical protein
MKGMMIKRYLDLLLYSVIAYLVLSYIGETSLWNEWLIIQKKLHCNACDVLVLHFPAQIVFIVFGIIITSLASYFQIYHPNRPLWPNLHFPPLTFSVVFAVLYWSFQSQQQLLNLITNSWGLIIGLLILPVQHFISRRYSRSGKGKSNHLLKNSQNHSVEKQKNSDDAPIECLADLDKELQHLSESLLRKLKDDSRHIAVCGAFGTGKSSIIKSAINELKEDHKDSWIHCNIDLWGVATHSIVKFVLEQITLALADHLDISSLRRLPANYLEAIKTSNTSWSFLASLLDKHESPEQVLKQIDEMLRLIDKKLIVTVQDIDRNENRQSSMAELAALLERLKQSVENITYIFAAERTTEFSETIRRICPVRLDVAKPTLTNKINNLHNELIAALPERYLSILSNQEQEFTESEAAMIADLLPSYRAFNELEKMVKQAWGNNDGEGRLAGEVYPHELILMYALKNENPRIFDLLDLVRVDDGEDTLAALLARYMPNVLESDKDLLVSVCKCLGLLDEHKIKYWTELPSDNDDESRLSETHRALKVKFNIKLNTLSVMNIDRKKLMLRGIRGDVNFSHLAAYSLFKEIADGNLDAVDTLISNVSQGSRDAWISALRHYGITIFSNSTEGFDLPKKIIFEFLAVPKASLSHSLMQTIDTTLQYSTLSTSNSIFFGYLVSEQFCDDVLRWTPYLKALALGDIMLMLRRISVSGRDSDLYVIQAKSACQRLIMDIANESSEEHIAILISFFCELGNDWRYLEELIQEALSSEDFGRIKRQLESVNLNSSGLLSAYQKLYPEYDFIKSDKLDRDYLAALAGLERLREK